MTALVPIEVTQNAFLQNEPVDSRRELAGIGKTPLSGGSQRPDLCSTAAPDACSLRSDTLFQRAGQRIQWFAKSRDADLRGRTQHGRG
jgi:hypothetical protein